MMEFERERGSSKEGVGERESKTKGWKRVHLPLYLIWEGYSYRSVYNHRKVVYEYHASFTCSLNNQTSRGKTKMAFSLFQIPAIFITILSLSKITPLISQLDQTQSNCKEQTTSLICQVQEMKLKVIQLESILDQSIQSLDMKFRYHREKVKLIEEMTSKTNFLHTVLANIKVDSTYNEERISTLEEEVRLLWATSRKNNFDIHILQSKAEITDNRIHAVTSEVRKMEDIITEQWIQIRQLDHALKITEMRTLKAQRRAAFTRCTFLKSIKGICGHYLPKYNKLLEPYLPGTDSVLRSSAAQALLQLKSTTSAINKYHHELQGMVKQAMEMNEFTAAFANQEIIFFMASALVLCPLWVAWMLLLSRFS